MGELVGLEKEHGLEQLVSRCAVVVCRWVLVPGVEAAEGGLCGAEAGQGARWGRRVGAARARMVESIPAPYRSWRWWMCGEARRRGRSRAGGMECGWEVRSACAQRGERRAGMARDLLEPQAMLVHSFCTLLVHFFVRARWRIPLSDIGCRAGCGAGRASASAQARCVAERSSSAGRVAAQGCDAHVSRGRKFFAERGRTLTSVQQFPTHTRDGRGTRADTKSALQRPHAVAGRSGTPRVLHWCLLRHARRPAHLSRQLPQARSHRALPSVVGPAWLWHSAAPTACEGPRLWTCSRPAGRRA